MTTEEQLIDLRGQLDDLERRFKELAEKPTITEPKKYQDKVLDSDGKLTHLYIGKELLPIQKATGDMTKAVYDTGDNGKVDTADDSDLLEGSNKAAVQDHTPKSHALNAHSVPVADISMNTHKITSVTNPAAAQDAATKKYVDDLLAAVAKLEYISIAPSAWSSITDEDTWEDWSLSAQIPAGALYAEITMYGSAAANIVGVRKNGSAINRYYQGMPANQMMGHMTVELDADRIVERYGKDADRFTVVGYWG